MSYDSTNQKSIASVFDIHPDYPTPGAPNLALLFTDDSFLQNQFIGYIAVADSTLFSTVTYGNLYGFGSTLSSFMGDCLSYVDADIILSNDTSCIAAFPAIHADVEYCAQDYLGTGGAACAGDIGIYKLFCKFFDIFKIKVSFLS